MLLPTTLVMRLSREELVVEEGLVRAEFPRELLLEIKLGAKVQLANSFARRASRSAFRLGVG